MAGGEERAVAGHAHARVRAALQDRADRQPRLASRLAELLGDLAEVGHRQLLTLLAENGLARLAACERLVQILGEDTAGDALVEPVRREQRQLDVVVGSAVLLADDHVLGDVDQTPRQVARVRSSERGVRKALASAVRRDEVLEHREAFHEVGLDRTLDDLTLRIRHQAAHAGELTDLLERSTCARVGHHEDRVELEERALHRVRDGVRRFRPDVDDLLVPLGLGDQAAVVVALDPSDALLILGKDLLLLRRDDDVVLRDRDPGQSRVLEAEGLDRVEQAPHRVGAVTGRKLGDERVGLALRERLVDELRLLGLHVDRLEDAAADLLVEDHAARSRHHQLAVEAILDRILEMHLLGVERELDLLLGLEPLRPRVEILGGQLGQVLFGVGEVIDPQHHVLRRRGQRPARCGREDVVRRQHQDPSLGLRLCA